MIENRQIIIDCFEHSDWLFANDIVEIQPTTKPTGLIYSLRYLYDEIKPKSIVEDLENYDRK